MGGIRSGDDFFSTSFGNSAFLNSVQDMEAAYREGRLGKPSASIGSLDSNVVSVKNTSGDDRARGEVIQLGTSLIDELSDFIDSPWFEGNAPDAEIGVDLKLGICQGPIPEDAIGEVQISGRVLARVNVTDILHTHCVAVDGEFVLKSEIGGPIEILSPLEDTGEQDVWVNLCSPRANLIGKTSDDIAVGASANYMVWAGTIAGGADSGITEIPSAEFTVPIDSGLFITITRVNNGWIAEPLECNP